MYISCDSWRTATSSSASYTMPKPSAGSSSYPCSSPASTSMSSREGAGKKTREITVNCYVWKRMLLVLTTVIVSSVCGCGLAVQPGAALSAARTHSPYLKEAPTANSTSSDEGARGLSWLPREDENDKSDETKNSFWARSGFKVSQPALAWRAVPAHATQSTKTPESQAAASGLAAGPVTEPAAAKVGENNLETAGSANDGSTAGATNSKRLRADSYSGWTAESEEHPLMWLGGKRRDEKEAEEEDKKSLARESRKDGERRADRGGEHSYAEQQEEETRGQNEERDKRSEQNRAAMLKLKSTDEKEGKREAAGKPRWMHAEGDTGAHATARQEKGVSGEEETEETSEEEDVSRQGKERTKQGEAQEETQAREEERGEEERRADLTETKEDEEKGRTGQKKDDGNASADRKEEEEEEGAEDVRAWLESEEGAREVDGGGYKSFEGYVIPKLGETEEEKDVDENAREEALETEKEGEEEEGANANRNKLEENEGAARKETEHKEKEGEENMIAEAAKSEEEEGETKQREGVVEIEEDEHATPERKETGENSEEGEQKSEDTGKEKVSAEAKEREEWEETQEESEEDDDEGEDGEDVSALGRQTEEYAGTAEEGKRDTKDTQNADWIQGRSGESATNEDSEGNEHEERVVVQPLPEREPQPRPRPLLSEYMSTLYLGHPPCPFPNTPWCNVEPTRDDRSPGRSSEMIQRGSTFASPILSLPFADSTFRFPYLWSAEGADSGYYGAAKVDIQRCRLTFTLDPLEPMDEIRLYMIPSERRVGIAANRKVKRSEERKAYFRVYGVETRWHTGGSIAEGCMASQELLKAGLIGWTYSGIADGGIRILVSFPSEEHAKDLLERRELREASYKLFLGGESLEQLTPSEKCALSGRTQSECDRLQEESGVQHVPVVAFSTEGFADDEVMIPEFKYV